jgi:hypothetical protein
MQTHLQNAPDASAGKIVCGLMSCRAPFKPRKPWQRYCCDAHRREANRLRGDGALRGVISTMRVLRSGEVSITLRFGLEEREGALQLAPGNVMEIL